METTINRAKFPLMLMGMLALLVAMWAGLIRLGWGLPSLQPQLAMAHGPLMVCSFLGTVIAIERAVALNRPWAYLGPLLTAVGGIGLIAGVPGIIPPLLITLGSLVLVFLFILILKIHTAIFTVTMTIGTCLWLIGNGLWLFEWPIYMVVPWWAGFLLLTIAGERLELNRVLRLSKLVYAFFMVIIAFFLGGLFLSLFYFQSSIYLIGAATVALTIWLFCFDVARYTIYKTGLTRFIAVCLLFGYTWLGISGLLGMIFGAMSAGPYYDAILHTFFIGFVISLIFGHAPIIFPAVLGKAMSFSPLFYSHLILLHFSLILRVVGDLAGWLPVRQWGGLLNVIAILLFIANTGWAVFKSIRGT